jgi:MFS superfamily sulfate permease-like transporter
LILYALLGSSRHLIVGPMSATAALSAAIIMPLARGDSGRYVALSAALAICTGLAGVLAALLRLGDSSHRSSPSQCSRASLSVWH